MANIPGINELNQVSAKLQDITNQLNGISQTTAGISLIPPGSLSDLEQASLKIERLSKANKRWGEILGPVIRKQAEANEGIKKTTKQITKYEGELKKSKDRLRDFQKSIVDVTKASLGEKRELERLSDQVETYTEAIKEANEEQKKFKKTLDSMPSKGKQIATVIGVDIAEGLEKMGKFIAKAGIGLFMGTINALADAFMHVYKWQERYVKMAGEFNQTLGPSTQNLAALRNQAFGLAGQFQAMGESFEYGMQQAQGFVQGAGFADKQTGQWMKTMIEFGRIMGMNGQEIGQLTKTFRNMDMSLKESEQLLSRIAATANTAGVDVASFSKDILQSRNDLASFGKQSKVFINAAGYARRLGIEVKTMVSVMKMTDTFEGAATAAAKLNTVFGTTINSMELMLEDDPGKRLEMLRRGLIGSGKDAANLSRREVRLIADTMQMTEEEVQGFLKAGVTYEDYMKKKAAEDKEAATVEKMRVQLMNRTVKTLFSFEAAFRQMADQMYQALIPLTDALGITDPNNPKAGWIGFGKTMGKVFKLIGDGIAMIAKNKNFQQFLTDIGDAITKVFAMLDKYISSGEFSKDFDSFIIGMREFFSDLKKLSGIVLGTLQLFRSPLQWIAEHIAGITESFLLLSGALAVFTKVRGLMALQKGVTGGAGAPGAAGGAAAPGAAAPPPLPPRAAGGGGAAAPIELEAGIGKGKFGSGAPAPAPGGGGVGASLSSEATALSKTAGAASKAAGALGKVGRVAGVVGTVYNAGMAAKEFSEGENLSATKRIGGTAAALAAAGYGAGYGATLGSMVLPGIGTAVGTILGGLVAGGMAYWAGEKITGAGASAMGITNASEAPAAATPPSTSPITSNTGTPAGGMSVGAQGNQLAVNVYMDGRVIQSSIWNPNNPAGVAASAGA